MKNAALNLIKIKSEARVQLTDRELSLRWWGRRSLVEQQEILDTYLPSQKGDSISYETIYWVWLKQQTL
jgi:hypothetical protein